MPTQKQTAAGNERSARNALQPGVRAKWSSRLLALPTGFPADEIQTLAKLQSGCGANPGPIPRSYTPTAHPNPHFSTTQTAEATTETRQMASFRKNPRIRAATTTSGDRPMTRETVRPNRPHEFLIRVNPCSSVVDVLPGF